MSTPGFPSRLSHEDTAHRNARTGGGPPGDRRPRRAGDCDALELGLYPGVRDRPCPRVDFGRFWPDPPDPPPPPTTDDSDAGRTREAVSVPRSREGTLLPADELEPDDERRGFSFLCDAVS